MEHSFTLICFLPHSSPLIPLFRIEWQLYEMSDTAAYCCAKTLLGFHATS